MAEHPDIRLLAATPGEASGLSKLHCRLFEKGWNTDGMRRLLEHPACVAVFAVSRQSSAVVGFVIAQLSADEAELLSLGVDAGWQRRGIGVALVEALTGLVKGKGARRLFLDVAESNAAALALYARLDFTRMGVRTDYYLHPDGRHENAFLMVRDIRDASCSTRLGN